MLYEKDVHHLILTYFHIIEAIDISLIGRTEGCHSKRLLLNGRQCTVFDQFMLFFCHHSELQQTVNTRQNTGLKQNADALPCKKKMSSCER